VVEGAAGPDGGIESRGLGARRGAGRHPEGAGAPGTSGVQLELWRVLGTGAGEQLGRKVEMRTAMKALKAQATTRPGPSQASHMKTSSPERSLQ